MLFFALRADILSLTLHCTDVLLNCPGAWQQDCFQSGLHLDTISEREQGKSDGNLRNVSQYWLKA